MAETKSALALRHVPFEDLGIFGDVLADEGFETRYLDAPVANLGSIDPLTDDLWVVLGGPIGAYEEDAYPFLKAELSLIEARLTAQKPIVGVCLGAQLIARALSARVYPGTAKEIGWAPITLTDEGQASPLGALGNNPQVLHWHGDTFDLPDGAIRLAATEITPNQAFGVGDWCLGLQFHLEADPAAIEYWMVGHANEIAATEGVTPKQIRADTLIHGPGLIGPGGEVLRRWLQGI
ncbi:MAG: glutamine amidotransferase [Alphaproteobacteria bacterium]